MMINTSGILFHNYTDIQEKLSMVRDFVNRSIHGNIGGFCYLSTRILDAVQKFISNSSSSSGVHLCFCDVSEMAPKA